MVGISGQADKGLGSKQIINVASAHLSTSKYGGEGAYGAFG